MKTIGLLGGMSWESTESYYRAINEGVKSALGGLHSAKIAMISVDFAEIESLQHRGDWTQTADILGQAALSLERAGADFIVICTNTMHKVLPEIQSHTKLPFLHIADATASVLLADGVGRVGLLGTRFTMEQEFYRERLDRRGLQVLVPNAADRDTVHRVIYEELCLGQIMEQSRRAYLDIVDRLAAQGAEAVILGCTEIGLLLGPQQSGIPLYDTTAIHAQAAVAMALT
jgi:aspartate racemase